MKIFLDTSSLLKLYHNEIGTNELKLIFSSANITDVFLAEIAKIEFTSAIWKKVRTKEITDVEATTTLRLFEADFQKYTFISADSIIMEQARLLITKYNSEGLRTLDSIQLSTCASGSVIKCMMGVKRERQAAGRDSFASCEARQSGVLSWLPVGKGSQEWH